MFFLPYRVAFEINRIPFFTLLIMFAGVLIYFEQVQSNDRHQVGVQTFCEHTLDASTQEMLTLSSLVGGLSCAEIFLSLRQADNPEDEIRDIVDSVPASGLFADTEYELDSHQRALEKAFGADAVLFVNITEWDTNYYVIGGNVAVAVAFVLKSTVTGETLWAYNARRQIDTSGNSNSGGGLIGAIIETAVKTAVQDYMPVARQVNGIAVSSMPFGRYHPQYDQDQLNKSVHPDYIAGAKN